MSWKSALKLSKVKCLTNYSIFSQKDFILALLITGGWSAQTSVEAVHVNGSNFCTLPDLPRYRAYHTQNKMTVCGGGLDSYNCMTLSQYGSWRRSHKLEESRNAHTSWVRGNEEILMGGVSGGKTSEVLTHDSSDREAVK